YLDSGGGEDVHRLTAGGDVLLAPEAAVPDAERRGEGVEGAALVVVVPDPAHHRDEARLRVHAAAPDRVLVADRDPPVVAEDAVRLEAHADPVPESPPDRGVRR